MNSKSHSLYNSWKALVSLIKTMYKSMPVLMVSFSFLIIYIFTELSLNTTAIILILSTVIVISSISIYIKSKNYGEAVLALAAGLLTVYTVSWTLSLFIGFVIIWVLFTIIVFFILSIRIASKIESIYIEASIYLNNNDIPDKQLKRLLEKISNSIDNSILMPEERAEIIRLFCFRKIEMDKMSTALKWVNIYYTITKIPYLDIAYFITDVIKNSELFEKENVNLDTILDYIYSGMREIPASPSEYMEAFKKTRYIYASAKSTILYFKSLNDYFKSGQSTKDIESFIKDKVEIR